MTRNELTIYAMKTMDNIFENLLACGIIHIDDVRNLQMEEIMNKLLKDYHKYKITKTSDGKWTTYVEDASRMHGRRLIKKSKESDIYTYLLDHYNIRNISKGTETFDVLFKEWIDYKKNFVNVRNTRHSISPSTIRRYERDYDTYIYGSDLARVRLSDITPTKLEVMLSGIIRKHDMAEKCTKNVLSCIRQAFSYARRSGFITKDPFEYVDVEMLLSNCREVVPRQDRILTKDEMMRLYKAIREKELLYPYYMPNYCVELAMYTGMRVGEISALHWGDVRDKLYIDYSEHRLDYRDKPSELIISEPKNRKHRAIPITSEMRDLFDRVRALGAVSDEGFIFVRPDGRRYTGHDIGCATARRAKDAGIDNTSIHEIRRTVSSLLNTKLSRRDVSDMLGHSEQVNERFYNYSTSEDAKKIDALRDVIQSYSPCF